eukprot:gene1298-11695_t
MGLGTADPVRVVCDRKDILGSILPMKDLAMAEGSTLAVEFKDEP